jgi:site-specific recombinase XerD
VRRELMPYGFIKYIENKGYSTETVKSYEKVIDQFFHFIRSTYPNNKEPFQISPSDIRNYLEEQLEREKSVSTINKELAIIKTMFHYFWEIDKVPVDPAVKIKRYKIQEKLTVEILYEQIIEVLNIVLDNNQYSPLRKAIFLLAVKGLKTADFRFLKIDVKDLISEGKMEIQLKNRSIILEGKEATVFRDYFHEAMPSNSEYLFVTKPHGEEHLAPIQVMSILQHLRAISQDYLPDNVKPLTLITIRRALAYNLYTKKYPIQSIAKEMGIEENTASSYLKNIVEGTLLKKTN